MKRNLAVTGLLTTFFSVHSVLCAGARHARSGSMRSSRSPTVRSSERRLL